MHESLKSGTDTESYMGNLICQTKARNCIRFLSLKPIVFCIVKHTNIFELNIFVVTVIVAD